MTDSVESEAAMKMATDIVVAYLNGRSVEPAELPELVLKVRAALIQDVHAPSAVQIVSESEVTQAAPSKGAVAPTPAVPIEESVTPDYIVSLEDGRRLKSLKRHLMAKYRFTPEDYRRKWGLPAEYPMVAPNYAKHRSDLAKQIGLGGRAQPEPASRARAAGRSRAKR